MSEITKEELQQFTDTYKQFNVLFEKILVTQTTLVEQQEKIVNRIYNGMAKDIVDGVKLDLDVCTTSIGKNIKDTLENTNNMKDDIKFSKWFIGVTSLLVVVVTVITTVILRGIDNRKLFKEEIKEIIQEVKAIK